jgi:hypothetical protein
VCLLVEGGEDLAAVGEGDHRSWMLALGVAQHPDWAEGDELQGEASYLSLSYSSSYHPILTEYLLQFV